MAEIWAAHFISVLAQKSFVKLVAGKIIIIILFYCFVFSVGSHCE